MGKLVRFFAVALFALGLVFIFSYGASIKRKAHAKKNIDLNHFDNLLKDGDIIFQSALSGQGQAVQIATNSIYSHCGLLYKKDGKWQVIEAVQPVKWTPLKQWIMHGDDYHFVVKRYKNGLDKSQSDAVKTVAEQYLNKDYDGYFSWDDDQIYCSELVWKSYERSIDVEVGELAQIQDMSLKHPIVQEKLRERYGEDIPMNEIVITPGAIFDCSELELVHDQQKTITKKQLEFN